MRNYFCALCGVSFGVDVQLYHGRISEDDLDWTEDFRILKKENETHEQIQSLDKEKNRPQWSFTNIGRVLEDSLSGNLLVFLPTTNDVFACDEDEEGGLGDKQYLIPYKDCGDGHEVVYPMHPVCLELLEQNYSKLARGTTFDIDILAKIITAQKIERYGQGIKPGWSSETYDGAEDIWEDEWDWMDEDNDYLVQNPASVQSFDDLLRTHPTLKQIENVVSYSSTVISPLARYALDYFSRLPRELLIAVACLLPTPDMCSARLASRAIANLSLPQTYWRSRFDFPHELSHVHLDPSWALSQALNGSVDWKLLYNTVLHPGHNDSAWFKNWNRIHSLTKKPAYKILGEQGVTIQAKDFTSNNLHPSSIIRQAFFVPKPSVLDPTTVMFNEKFPLEEVRKISVTFRGSLAHGGLFVSGVAFYGASEVKKLGECRGTDVQSTVIERRLCFAGFILTIAKRGIIGVQTLVSDATGLRSAMEPALGSLTDDWNVIGLGRLTAIENSRIDGLRIAISKRNCIVSVGLLESIPDSNESRNTKNATSSLGNLWQPSLPPQHFIITPSSGSKNRNEFRYSKHIMFGQKEEDVKSLTTVTCYYSLSPPGLKGLQFHFKNGSLVPNETWYGGRGVEFCIDGPGGEILSGVDVFWSDETKCLGISFLTNRGRRSAFNQSIINEKFAVERLLAPPGTLIIGVYVDIIHVDQYRPNWKGFGLICVPVECSSPLDILPELQEYPLLDDHFNMWTGDFIPIPGYLCGETIGSQPSNGFTNWICFDNGIKKLKPQLDRRASSQSNSRYLVNPVSDLIDSAFTMLSLNRQRVPGPLLVMRDDENISEITVVSTTVGNIPQIVEIKLETNIGPSTNIFTEAAGDRGINQEGRITLESSSSLILVGLAWSFDLGLLRPAMHGLQPIYKLRDGVEHPDIQSTLYPKMKWAKPPPVDLQLRPIPAMQSNMSSFESSVPSHSSNHRRLSASSMLVVINVFFNCFLQGIEFFYQDGLKETAGNLIGSSHQIVLGIGESIFSVQFYERVQCIFSDATYPRDVMCVEGISFGLVKFINGKPQTRLSPYCGCSKPFGPFLKQQNGLWRASQHRSMDWLSSYLPQTRDIVLAPGTSFVGIYAEILPTLIRRAGVLVSGIPSGDVDEYRKEYTLLTPSQHLYDSDQHLAPWLGNSPPSSYDLKRPLGATQGEYRFWCPIPSSLNRIIIHRQLVHTSKPTYLIIGLELQGDSPASNALLGFRSLCQEDAVIISLNYQCTINGLCILESNTSDEFAGLTSLGVMTDGPYGPAIHFVESSFGRGFTPMSFIPVDEEKVPLIQTVSPNKSVRGLYAFVGEHINAIGILEA